MPTPDLLSYFFLVFRLILSLAGFLLQLALTKISHLKILFVSIAIFIFSIVYFFNQLKVESPGQKIIQMPYPKIINQDLINQEELLSYEQLKQHVEKSKKVLQIQPTHQALLLNLAIEKQLLEQNSDDNQQLINKAVEIYPNSPLISRLDP